jgi:2-phosphoglycerate kinase
MAKITVLKGGENDRSPFLRGILVQSLVNAGLSFAEAYDLAQNVRNELQDVQEITSTRLRERVADMLEASYGKEVRQAYASKPHREAGIIVHAPTRSAPFSAGILAHSLEACGITPEVALQGARKVHARLQQTGHREIDHKALRRVIYRCLYEHCSPEMAERYLSWRRFENSGDALIILVGGTTGSGKSTVSAELAYRLNISRSQSTDMMREIIRAYLSPQLVPTLGYSSFEAWRGLPGSIEGQSLEIENLVVAGFLSQFAAMKLALEATINRAIKERHHLIVEGVHVVPTELSLDTRNGNAIVVPLKLATMKKSLLRRQLKRRGSRESGNLSKMRYLEKLDDIWELQSWLLSEADKAGIPIIQNWLIEDTVREALEHVTKVIMKHYPPHLPDKDDGVWH